MLYYEQAQVLKNHDQARLIESVAMGMHGGKEAGKLIKQFRSSI